VNHCAEVEVTRESCAIAQRMSARASRVAFAPVVAHECCELWASAAISCVNMQPIADIRV